MIGGQPILDRRLPVGRQLGRGDPVVGRLVQDPGLDDKEEEEAKGDLELVSRIDKGALSSSGMPQRRLADATLAKICIQ